MRIETGHPPARIHECAADWQADLIVLGRNDDRIPWPQSLSLAAATPEGQTRVFLIHRGLGHVDLSVFDLLSWRFWTQDLPDLWRVIDLLLAEREAAP